MLQNNVEMDLKMRMIEDSTTQTELAEKLFLVAHKLGSIPLYILKITLGRRSFVESGRAI